MTRSPDSQAAPLNSNALYVSPTGAASAAGTAGAPTSLVSAISRITAGGTIYAHGGTYVFASPVPIDPSTAGILVQYAGDNGIFIGGSTTSSSAWSPGSIAIPACRSPGAWPAHRADWPSYNLVLSSESHDNKDAGGENADGFAAKLTAGPGNVFRYDVSHNNVDDGWISTPSPRPGPLAL